MNPLCAVETCDKPVRDVTVCQSCHGQLCRALGDLPALSEELDTTLTRQTALGERNGGRSATKPLPYDPRASEVSWVLRNTLVGWVRELDDGWPADTVADMARFLLARVDRLRTHPAGGEAVDEITAVASDAWRVVDRPADRVYAGPCIDCGTDVTARRGASEARCGTCGATYGVDEQNTWMRQQIEDQLFTASEATGMCHWLRVQVSYETIRYYARKGYILTKSTNTRGHEMYRFGDILDAKAEREGLQRAS